MKYLLIVGDGMADYPVPELGNKTPLQVAKKPNIDMLAAKGRNGKLRTVPEGLTPGSGTAIISVLGYDPKEYYTGRGPFEAAARNIKLDQNDIAYRCNLISEKDGILSDYSAGHISNNESKELIDALKTKMEKPDYIEFFAGLSYRHFLILRNYMQKEIVECTPPHDATGTEISKILPKAKTEETKSTADLLNRLILASKKVLENHPINVSRRKIGKKPGNMIWPWGGGRKPVIPTYKEKYGVDAAVISAVDLVKGIGVYTGMKVVGVPGATGLYDTNYEGKVEFAIQTLEDHDMVFVHVEAPDEAGHSRDYKLKVKTIEDLDKRLIGRLLNGLKEDCVIAVLPDHPTPIKVGTHTADPVPFAIYSPYVEADGVKKFDEFSAKNGRFGLLEGEEFILHFLGKAVTKKSDKLNQNS
ncbi:MAG: cofactor-independent phosphoglycerate mutase [Candidatus Bathyarchaeota archaeon]|nr:cofactor-independent phosphoglycerate mutase [Candidatus Bathyarchaeota archaeon]